MEQTQQLVQDGSRHLLEGKEALGYGFDVALAGGAVGAWLLEIEHLLGAVGAAIIFILALATSIYRTLYWRAKAKTQEVILEREEDK